MWLVPYLLFTYMYMHRNIYIYIYIYVCIHVILVVLVCFFRLKRFLNQFQMFNIITPLFSITIISKHLPQMCWRRPTIVSSSDPTSLLSISYLYEIQVLLDHCTFLTMCLWGGVHYLYINLSGYSYMVYSIIYTFVFSISLYIYT